MEIRHSSTASSKRRQFWPGTDPERSRPELRTIDAGKLLGLTVSRLGIDLMAIIFGSVVVLTAVLVGFTMAGGHVGSLIHPSEFVTIGGAAIGAMLIMSPAKVLKDLWHAICASLKGPA